MNENTFVITYFAYWGKYNNNLEEEENDKYKPMTEEQSIGIIFFKKFVQLQKYKFKIFMKNATKLGHYFEVVTIKIG